MKFKRQLTAFMAAALISGSITPQVFAANFADINDVPWEGAKTYINAVADAGLMVGDYNNSGAKVFRARDKVSYCETMQLVYALMKNYTGTSVESSVVTKYTTVMSGYKIPSWAYEAVAYGLENGIVTISDIPGFVNASGASVNATRQDVAIMLGRALKSFETVNNNASLSFKDASSVSSVAVPYVDLLNRLGIITGDDLGNFNPKNYINRAETAVVVSKTYDLIKSKTNGSSNSNTNNNTNNNTNTSTSTGSATGIVTAAETVGGQVVLTLSTSSGNASYSGTSSLSCLKGADIITLSQIVVGDKVLVSYSGQTIKSVVVTQPASSSSSTSTSTSTSTSATSFKGTFTSISRTLLTVRIDGVKKTFDIDDVDYVKFYYDGDSCDYDEFKDEAKSGDSVVIKTDKNGYVIRVEADEGDGEDSYDIVGYFDGISSSDISLKKNKTSSTSTDYSFKNDNRSSVTFYVGTSEKDYTDFKAKLEDDVKIGLVTNSSDKVIEVYLITDDDDDDYDKTGYVYKVTDEYIRITTSKSSTDYKTYDYKNSDSDDVTFYVDDKKKDYDDFYDAAEKGLKVGLMLNSDDEITKIYLETDKDDEDYDETGYLYKLSDEYIRLTSSKSSSSYDEYEFKNKDSDDVTFYVNGSSKSYNAFEDKVSKGDKIGLILNSSDKVTKVYLISGSSSDTDEVEGKIRTISDSYIKLTGISSNYIVDDADDIDVDVTDGTDTIDDYDDLVDAINDDDKEAQITIEYDDDNYIVSIEGYISKGKGYLSSISTSNKTIKIEFDSGDTTTYKYKSSIDIELDSYSSSISGLEKAIANEEKKDREVTIVTDEDGYITELTSTDI